MNFHQTSQFLHERSSNCTISTRTSIELHGFYMNFHKNYRDLSILWFVGIYLLNVLDANVGAHLLQFNVESKLTIKPYLDQSGINSFPTAGINLNLKF